MTASVAITVSPAPLTSYTSRACAGTCRRPLRAEQRHAFLAARHQQRVDLELAAQPLRASVEFALAASRSPATARNSARFGVISVAPLVAREIVAFGIDQHRLAMPAREADHARDVREPALAVVGQYYRIATRDELRIIGELGAQDLVARRGFEIDTQQLLLRGPITRSLTVVSIGAVAMQARA